MTDETAIPSLRSVLRDFAAFLRHPALLTPQGLRSAAAWRTWGWLTALLIAGLLVVLAPLLGAWQKAFSLPSPDAFKAVSKQMLVPIVVLIAPVLEELLFRGWQSGRPRALWLLGCAAAAMAVLIVATEPSQALLVAGVMLAALIAAPAGWWLLRRRSAPLGWFARAFPAIFYLVAAGFALVHLTNYPSFSLLALPLVLPQLWAGLVLGFVRQRLGLLPAMLTHALANACSLSLALLSGG